MSDIKKFGLHFSWAKGTIDIRDIRKVNGSDDPDRADNSDII